MHETTTACSERSTDDTQHHPLAPSPLSSPSARDCERRAEDHSADKESPRVIGASLRFEVALRKDAFGLGIYFSEAVGGRAVVDPTLPFYRLPDGTEAPGERSRAIAPGDVLCAIDGRSLEALAFSLVVDELRRLSTGAVTLAFERPMPLRMAALTLQPGALSAQAERCEQQLAGRRADERGLDTEDRSASDPFTAEHAESGAPSAKQQRWSVFHRWSAAVAGAGSATDAAGVAALEQLLADAEEKVEAAAAALEREKKCRFLAEKKNILYRNELLRLSGESSSLRFELSRQQRVDSQREEFCVGKLHLAI
ncbi:hypothetical protein PybrP1_002217 [[Pythium] brassicae (nom. inval.)]|nr:hypothetical protein PybrP1_002217 [[Pythium] brassicae (nom. inval.)]